MINVFLDLLGSSYCTSEVNNQLESTTLKYTSLYFLLNLKIIDGMKECWKVTEPIKDNGLKAWNLLTVSLIYTSGQHKLRMEHRLSNFFHFSKRNLIFPHWNTDFRKSVKLRNSKRCSYRMRFFLIIFFARSKLSWHFTYHVMLNQMLLRNLGNIGIDLSTRALINYWLWKRHSFFPSVLNID